MCDKSSSRDEIYRLLCDWEWNLHMLCENAQIGIEHKSECKSEPHIKIQKDRD